VDELYFYRAEKTAMRLTRNRNYWTVFGGGQFDYFVTDDFGNLFQVEMP